MIYLEMFSNYWEEAKGDVLKLLGEGGLKIMKKLINTAYETGEWPKDFTEVTMIALAV